MEEGTVRQDGQDHRDSPGAGDQFYQVLTQLATYPYLGRILPAESWVQLCDLGLTLLGKIKRREQERDRAEKRKVWLKPLKRDACPDV